MMLPQRPHFPSRRAFGFIASATIALLTRFNAVFAEEVVKPATGLQTAGADIYTGFYRGGAPMWALAVIFAMAVYEGVTQLLFLTRRNHAPVDFEKDVGHVADTKGMDAGISLCKESPSSLARVLQAALIRHGSPLGQIEAAVRHETALAKYVMLRRTRTLGWLAAIAPMLGLLGLVSNLTRHTEIERVLDSEAGLRHLITGFSEGVHCFTFSLVVSLLSLSFYLIAQSRALDLAHDIEVKAIDTVVTLDRKSRQSIRLIEDIEERIKTESSIKVPDLSAEFEDHPQPHESASKTNVTTHAGGPVQP